MNRLYKPKSAVGEVLTATYATFGGGRDRADEWARVYEGPRMADLRQRVAELIRWGVHGAPDLDTMLDALDEETTGSLFTDYTALFKNFEALEGRAKAVHDDWKEYGQLREFIQSTWSKVKDLYNLCKGIPASWIDMTSLDPMMKADKAFLAAFAKADYRGAVPALNELIPAMKVAVNAAIPIIQLHKSLRTDCLALQERQEAVEGQVQAIGERQPPLEFFAMPAGQAVLRMRLRQSQAVRLLEGQPMKAKPAIDAWDQSISTAAELVQKAFDGLAQLQPEAKPKQGKAIELADLPFEGKPITPMPDEVDDQYQRAAELIAPKDDEGAPTIAELKATAALAYKTLDESEGDKDKGPLFDAFQKAIRELTEAADRWNLSRLPAAQLAGERVTELAKAGLLKAMRTSEKLDLLGKLRGACAPMVTGEFNRTLTELGRAQAQLLASFEMDDDFRKADREKRQAAVQQLVQAHKEELKKALDGWPDVNDEDRLKLCKQLVATQCGVLKIEVCPVSLKRDDKGTAGYFSPPDRAIFINDHEESAYHYSFEAVSNTLFHETSHWWQHVKVEAFAKGDIPLLIDGKPNPEYVQVQMFACNHGSAHPHAYVNSKLDHDLYRAQPMEAHAYEVGDEMQQMMLDALLG